MSTNAKISYVSGSFNKYTPKAAEFKVRCFLSDSIPSFTILIGQETKFMTFDKPFVTMTADEKWFNDVAQLILDKYRDRLSLHTKVNKMYMHLYAPSPQPAPSVSPSPYSSTTNYTISTAQLSGGWQPDVQGILDEFSAEEPE